MALGGGERQSHKERRSCDKLALLLLLLLLSDGSWTLEGLESATFSWEGKSGLETLPTRRALAPEESYSPPLLQGSTERWLGFIHSQSCVTRNPPLRSPCSHPPLFISMTHTERERES